MGVTVTNLIQGPATLYTGASYTGAYSAAAEPANAAINTTPQASAYTDVGGTVDGVNAEHAMEWGELAVDQILDVADRRQTKREFTIATNMAEATLENYAIAVNDSPPVTGSGFKYFEPNNTYPSVFVPNYRPLLFDGFAPTQFRRRVIARRMLSMDPVAFAYKKDGQTILTTKWGGHYVSSSIAPYKIVDQTS